MKYHNKNALCAFRSSTKIHPPFLSIIFSGHSKKVFGFFHSDGSGEPNDDQQSQHLYSDGSGCCGSLRTNIRLSQPSSLFGNLVSHNSQKITYYLYSNKNRFGSDFRAFLFQYFSGVTASTTFASAVSYAFTKKVYTLKNKADDEQFGKRLTAFILFICFNVGFIYLMPKTEHKPSTLKLTQNMDT